MKPSGETPPHSDLRALYTSYSIPQAAALWCGVPEDQVEEVLKEATPFSDRGEEKNIWVHPSYPDLEFKSRALIIALTDETLPDVRLDGVAPFADVSLEHRKILGRDLKQWMEQEFPNDRPAFLFGEAQQDAGSPVSAEEFQALQAKCDALKKALAKNAAPGERSERTYQHIIAVLLQCIEGELPDLEAHPAFASEAKLIEFILEHYPRTEGLSKSTLQRKFPEAKRALQSA